MKVVFYIYGLNWFSQKPSEVDPINKPILEMRKLMLKGDPSID